MRIRLSKKIIDELAPADKEYVAWDRDAPGLGLRVRPSGSMVFIFQYRSGVGRGSQSKKVTIGSANKITADNARLLAKQYSAQIANGEDPAASKADRRNAPTISALYQAWMDEMQLKGEHKPRTTELYASLKKNHIDKAFGTKKSIDFTRKELAAWHRSYSDKPIIANRVVNTLSAMFNWGAAEGLIPVHNPTVNITLYPEKGKERYLTADEYLRLAQTVDEAERVGLKWDPKPSGKTKHAPKDANRYVKVSPYVIAAIRLFLFTGARLREILNMRWSEYDASRGIATIPDGKGGKQTLVLSSAAIEVIESLERSGDRYVG